MIIKPRANPWQSMPKPKEKPSFFDLLEISLRALGWDPTFLITGFVGQPGDWLPPYKVYSEYQILNPVKLGREIKFLANITIPSIPADPPQLAPAIIDELFWEPTLVWQHPDQYGQFTTFPREAWFFINGIMTDKDVATMNAEFLAHLFHRPLTMIQKESNSVLVDLYQCALGKEWNITLAPATQAFPPIYDALKSDKERVVVIAHSMGTIIMGEVLLMLNHLDDPRGIAPAHTNDRSDGDGRHLNPDQHPFNLADFEPLTESEWEKLEVYCFANCTNRMKFHRPATDDRRPLLWIESFGNQHDIVARLGMFAPPDQDDPLDLDGVFYMRKGAYGHLLNEHYLYEIERCQKDGLRRGPVGGQDPYILVRGAENHPDPTPRLFCYINGGRPEDCQRIGERSR